MYTVSTICDFLQQHQIPYQRFDHPPVFTCEEASALHQPMPGTDTKNLFLRDKKGKRHLLVTIGHACVPERCPYCDGSSTSACRHEKRVSIPDLEKIIDAKALSFASPDRLKKYLGVEPGAVTMLGLINDTEHAVEFYIDREVWESETLCCHPLVNTATLAISRSGLEKFFKLTGHVVHTVDVLKS